jgi:hypothetical protein
LRRDREIESRPTVEKVKHLPTPAHIKLDSSHPIDFKSRNLLTFALIIIIPSSPKQIPSLHIDTHTHLYILLVGCLCVISGSPEAFRFKCKIANLHICWAQLFRCWA